MIIKSDLHIHSEFSYDATLPLEEIATQARLQGMKQIGIADHANFNDKQFLGDLYASANGVKEAQKKYPEMILGVELTPIEKPQFDYIAKTGTREGYIPPVTDAPYPIELAASKDELISLGVRYAIGASHWRVDLPDARHLPQVRDELIKEWYRQQLWLACDERVTILGHPWYIGSGIWYDDFSVIPHSMNMEIAAALKENGKYAECNPCTIIGAKASEKFRHQYAEFLRELFEMGIPITYGSDAHKVYNDRRTEVEKYLAAAGFKEGDFSELAESDLW